MVPTPPDGAGPGGHGPAQPMQSGESTSIGGDPMTAAGGDALPGDPDSVGREAGGSGDRAAGLPVRPHLLDVALLLKGEPVRGPELETLGSVSALWLDPATGRIAYVVLEPLPGLLDGPRAIPWAALQAETGHGLRLQHAAASLRLLPALREGRIPEDDVDWIQQVHAFFGCRPYWVP